MKLAITFLLSIISFALFSQNPSYEETVDYIKTNTVGRMLYKGPLDSYERATGYKLTNIVIEKNGRIKLITNQKNGIHDFEIVFNIFDLTSSIDYPDGIRAYKFLVHFKGLNVTEGYGITFATENDAIKVARALRHLKTLCSKEDDLFGKPTQQEKATLTKSETMEYIKNVINNQEDLTARENDYHVTDNRLKQNIYDNKIIKYYERPTKRKDGKYKYDEASYSYSIDFMNTPFEKVSLLSPNTSHAFGYDEPFTRFYCVSLKINNNTSIMENWESRECGFDSGNYWSSPSQAKNSCKSKSWRSFNPSKVSQINIYVKEEANAKRLKKAFEHLTSIINEEKNTNKANDPFGE